ncbi:MAG: hypothetical protein PHX08_08880 [Lachnospiraceae bacterium]|nr:hypothetical protein [Lachnospiraceae bacterium]
MAKATIKASNADIMNQIRDQLGTGSTYQARVPVAYSVDGVNNYRDVYSAIMNYTPNKNDFIGNLYNMIGQMFITKTRDWKNPLKKFRRQNLMYGDTVAEVAVNTFKAHTYQSSVEAGNCGTVFCQEIPEAMEIFHTLNRQEFYEATINEAELRSAMLNENGLGNFVTATMTQLYNSDEKDEYRKSLEIFRDNYAAYNMVPVKVTPVTTKETAQALVSSVREYHSLFRFIGRNFNTVSLDTFSDPSDIQLFITPKLEAFLDVFVEAMAYNLDKSILLGNIEVVDSFGPGMEDVQCIMCDRDALVIMDRLYESNAIYDPRHLVYNNYLHHWEVLSFSTFVNCVAFTTEDITLAVTPATATVAKGGTQQITVKVGTADITQKVKYSLTGQTSANTTIIGNGTNAGLVTIGSDETATTITVGVDFGTSTGTSTITVSV